MRNVLIELTVWCLQLLGLAWLVAAVWFAARWPGTVGRKLIHFFVTLIPEPWLLVVWPVVAVLLALVPHRFWQSLYFWHPALAIPGVTIVVVSTVLMLWSRWTLGIMWAGRPMVQQNHELRTTGVYGLVRHPIYTGFIGLALGGMLVVGFGQMIAYLVATALLIAWRVWSEERMMIATFGDRYRDYRRAVPALVPFLRGLPAAR